MILFEYLRNLNMPHPNNNTHHISLFYLQTIYSIDEICMLKLRQLKK